MPMGRKLNVCCSMIKRPSSFYTNTLPKSDDSQDESSKSSMSNSTAASPSSSIFKNFNSLYDPTDYSDSNITGTNVSTTASTLTTTSSDLSSAIASRRMLLSSPGRSNSIIDSYAIDFGIGVAVPTYSPDPYKEFQRSMAEMATTMKLLDPSEHRERLYELLICYLALNRKNLHSYIVGAFIDLLTKLGLGTEDGQWGT